MINKKEYGQFFTNPSIAEFMIGLGMSTQTKKILDPAVGPGIFIKKVNLLNNNLEKTAFEIDKKMVSLFKKNINDNTKIINDDYLKYDLNEKYDLIICNPPYKKFQEIDNRKELIQKFYDNYHIKLSGYTNYCMYFLVKSLNELSNNGKCIYIIPYEFLNCGYGEIIKKYLIESKKLKCILKFNSKIKLFDEAMTTSCIIVLENNNNDEVEFININTLEELNINKFNNVHKYKYGELDCHKKWLKYFNTENAKINKKNLVKLKEFATVKRGIATGNNKYFSLNKEMIEKYNLSKEVCMPCIIKSPDIKCQIFDIKQFNKLYNDNKKVYLFNGINSKTAYDNDYIKLGKKLGIDKLYLTSHRNPWYSLEEKAPAQIWISVFSRNKIKVVRNEAMIKNLTTFHGIYLKNLSNIQSNVLFCYLLSNVGQQILYMNKREYGEGLDKFEPNDLNNAFVLNIECITDEDIVIINSIYKNLKLDYNRSICRLDEIFEKYVYVNL